MKMQHYDIAVIGAGVFGAAIAYQLSKSGRSVVICDDRMIGQNASGQNAGNLNPIYKTPESLIPLALRSFDLHQRILTELLSLGIQNYQIKEVKRILLASNDEEATILKKTQKIFTKYKNFSTHLLNKNELRVADDRLSLRFEMGLLLEGNKCVDSFEFNKSLIEAAKIHGTRFIQAKVDSITKDHHKVVEVKTLKGHFSCGDIIFATGPWVSEMNTWFNLKLPIEPLKGQILRIKAPPNAGLSYDFTYGLQTLYKRGENEIWVGVTNEKAGFDEAITQEAKDHLLGQATVIMPSLLNTEILEHSASLRAITPSELPIATRVPSMDNVYIANGGGWKGVLLSLGVAEIICDLINHKKATFQKYTHQII